MSIKVRDYEKQIDQLVYKLYGFPPEAGRHPARLRIKLRQDKKEVNKIVEQQ